MKQGDIVSWKWFGTTLKGQVVDIITDKAEIISKGSYITRKGTPENPAVVILYKEVHVLKRASELTIVEP